MGVCFICFMWRISINSFRNKDNIVQNLFNSYEGIFANSSTSAISKLPSSMQRVIIKLWYNYYNLSCKLPATEVAGVSNPESWFDLFGLSLSDYLIFIFTFILLRFIIEIIQC